MSAHLADTPVLKTERLVLRAPGPQDTGPALAFLTSGRSTHIGGPYSAYDAWLHMGHNFGHWIMRGYGLFTICLRGSDTPIGDIGPFFPDGWAEHELGWALWDAADEGKGYATEAAIAARAYAYETLGWTTAVSYIDPDNARSIALAERLGCTLDAAAALPQLPDWDGTLVYRHPAPEET